MKDENPEQWCARNNWTEPRQLQDGVWVAFPPGGIIEAPLPHQSAKSKVQPKSIHIRDFVDGMVMIIGMIIVGVIALVISPLFIAPNINRVKKKISSKMNNE
ncbi:hypothetical protein [Pleurocapsa sp. PCC 7319]|uniref:hypothetical protein n=1 Tax=Pleurocapsa sp. PCC 7319 TaxID=118161 RepID=UPI000346265C|nr:hypothetical protein [Pleurocapsa sp. PCC 7319]